MLTSLINQAKFVSLMRNKFKTSILLISILMLQSCYTLIYPPQTLPATSTVTTEFVEGSTVNVVGYSDWDPYWEPVLPYTNYYRGYGASYYDPFNYYDYHHPYYAPVYVTSEEPRPIKGREIGREDEQISDRIRDQKNSTNGAVGGYVAPTSIPQVSTIPVVSTPVVKNPKIEIKKSPIKKQTPPDRKTKTEVKPVIKQTSDSNKKDDQEQPETKAKNTRVRTRK
ncbi:MAG: hypothetical protein K9N35_07435 [Candidatus Marinimicrobia bacterium]|nr:hypothetical protein [Candidatus Neomarinimicrobiota bacterium]